MYPKSASSFLFIFSHVFIQVRNSLHIKSNCIHFLNILSITVQWLQIIYNISLSENTHTTNLSSLSIPLAVDFFLRTILSTCFLIVIVEIRRNLGEHGVTVIWRGQQSLGNIIQSLNISINFLVEDMCKSDQIWVACGANAVDMLIVAFKSIACGAMSTCHPDLQSFKESSG